MNREKCIEIIEQNKDKYRFIIGTYADGDGRCAVGLLLSVYGWNGNKDNDYQYICAWDRLKEEDLYDERHTLAQINDRCDNWNQLIAELKKWTTWQ